MIVYTVSNLNSLQRFFFCVGNGIAIGSVYVPGDAQIVFIALFVVQFSVNHRKIGMDIRKAPVLIFLYIGTDTAKAVGADDDKFAGVANPGTIQFKTIVDKTFAGILQPAAETPDAVMHVLALFRADKIILALNLGRIIFDIRDNKFHRDSIAQSAGNELADFLQVVRKEHVGKFFALQKT